MIPLLLLLASTPLLARGDTAVATEEVAYASADGVTLAGLLILPEGEGPFPGAVIIQGSGDSDRTNYWARSIANALAASGVVTLLPDKRGSGLSGGDWRTASFETLAADALAGLRLVAARPEVKRGAVGLVGLSQGGHIAPLAAAASPEVAWVVDVSGAAVSMIEQIRHEMRNTAEQAGLSPGDVERVLEIQHLAERYVESGEWEPYAVALRQAEGSAIARIAAGFPQTPDSPVWSWARLNGYYDPIPHWAEVRVPILVAYGQEDEKDNVPVAESVRRLRSALAGAGHPDFTIRVFPGSGHGLWEPGHEHRHHPELRRDFVDLLTRWVRERTAGD